VKHSSEAVLVAKLILKYIVNKKELKINGGKILTYHPKSKPSEGSNSDELFGREASDEYSAFMRDSARDQATSKHGETFVEILKRLVREEQIKLPPQLVDRI
jgi:hypothetical protein